MKPGTADATDRRTVSRRRFVRGVAAAGLLGAAAPASAQEGTPTATPTTEYELGAQISAWVGQKPDAIANEENPTLRLVAGRTYTITWVNLDGQQHQLQILNEAGESIAESDVVSTQGGTGAVEFEATEDVAAYRSSINPSMRGRIRIVQPGTRTTAGTSTAAGNATRTTAARATERTTGGQATNEGTPVDGAATTGTTAATADTASAVDETAGAATATRNATDAGATTDALATTITEGGETFGAGGASSRGQPGFGLLAGVAGVAGLLGLRRIRRRGD